MGVVLYNAEWATPNKFPVGDEDLYMHPTIVSLPVGH